LRLGEASKMSWHGIPIVGHEDSICACRNSEYVGIRQSYDVTLFCGPKTYRGFATPKTFNHFLVEVGIGLKAGSHSTGVRAL
jgi:hypothetical protein